MSYKDDPEYKKEAGHTKGKLWAAIGYVFATGALGITGAVLMEKANPFIGGAVFLSAAVPAYLGFKRVVEWGKKEREIEMDRIVKQTAKEIRKELELEKDSPARDTDKNWQKEIVAQASASQLASGRST